VVFGQSLLGMLSDRLGRRRVIAGVMAMDAFFFGLTAASTDPGSLLAIRIACGLFAPISLSISWVADVSATKTRDVYKRNFANVGLMFNVGALLGGAAGGLLGPTNWLAANLLSAAPCVAASLWALGSTNPISPLAAGASRAVRGVGTTLRAFPYRVVCAQYFMAGAVLGSFYSLAPVMLAGQHGATAGEIAALMLSAAAWNIANNAFVIRPLLLRLGALRFVVAASVVSGLSNAALAAGESSLVATYLLYPIIYVSTALQLTVLNMMSSSYAVRFQTQSHRSSRLQPIRSQHGCHTRWPPRDGWWPARSWRWSRARAIRTLCLPSQRRSRARRRRPRTRTTSSAWRPRTRAWRPRRADRSPAGTVVSCAFES
jgi:MFS family permease